MEPRIGKKKKSSASKKAAGESDAVVQNIVMEGAIGAPESMSGTIKSAHGETHTTYKRRSPQESGMASNLAAPGGEEKEARIEIRVEKSLKELIEKAAALLGQSISSFMISKSVIDAQQVIDEYARTRATLADWERFQEILSNPEPPNAALRKAAGRYKESVTRTDGF